MILQIIILGYIAYTLWDISESLWDINEHLSKLKPTVNTGDKNEQ
jgi:hypothetical protein